MPNAPASLLNLGDVAYLLGGVLRIEWIVALARAQGRWRYRRSSTQRTAVRENLRLVFGSTGSPVELDEMTRRFFEQKQLRLLLFYLFPRLAPAVQETLFPLDGTAHLDRALSEKRGVVFVGSHLNSVLVFVAGQRLAAQGYDVRVALPTPDVPYAPGAIREFLARAGLGRSNGKGLVYFHAQFNIRSIIRALGENAVVILMGDGTHSAGFVDVDFLGRRVPFPTGAMSIARLTGSPVVPFFVTGAPPRDLRIRIEEPIPLDEAGERRAVDVLVGDYAQRLERHLRHNAPSWENWLNEHALDPMTSVLQRPLKDRYTI